MELLLAAPYIVMVGCDERVAFDKMNQISHDKWSSSFKGWQRCAVVVPRRRFAIGASQTLSSGAADDDAL